LKSELQRNAQVGVDARRRVGSFQVDELDQENLFDDEQNTENRGTRRQSERVPYGPAVCRRRRFQAMTLALPVVTRCSARISERAAGPGDGISDVASFQCAGDRIPQGRHVGLPFRANR